MLSLITPSVLVNLTRNLETAFKGARKELAIIRSSFKILRFL